MTHNLIGAKNAELDPSDLTKRSSEVDSDESHGWKQQILITTSYE